MAVELTAPVLVVDDDPKIVSLLRTYLEREGYDVLTAGDGRSALAALERRDLGLVVLDVMLPEVDGLTVLRAVRERSDVPVVILSARGGVADRVYGLSEGADDYLPKPFSPAELVVRVRSVLRRAQRDVENRGAEPLRCGDLAIDVSRREVRRGRDLIAVTPAEFTLLAALVGARGRLLTRQALLDALYGSAQGEALERTVDVHIGRLRAKLGDQPENPRYVRTVRGSGYRALVE